MPLVERLEIDPMSRHNTKRKTWLTTETKRIRHSGKVSDYKCVLCPHRYVVTQTLFHIVHAQTHHATCSCLLRSLTRLLAFFVLLSASSSSSVQGCLACLSLSTTTAANVIDCAVGSAAFITPCPIPFTSFPGTFSFRRSIRRGDVTGRCSLMIRICAALYRFSS